MCPLPHRVQHVLNKPSLTPFGYHQRFQYASGAPDRQGFGEWVVASPSPHWPYSFWGFIAPCPAREAKGQPGVCYQCILVALGGCSRALWWPPGSKVPTAYSPLLLRSLLSPEECWPSWETGPSARPLSRAEMGPGREGWEEGAWTCTPEGREDPGGLGTWGALKWGWSRGSFGESKETQQLTRLGPARPHGPPHPEASKGRSTPTEGGHSLALEAHALREHPTPGLVIVGMVRKGRSDTKAQGGGTAGWSAGTPLSWNLP